jgi:hypothetical protein
MRKFILILASMVSSAAVFAQTPATTTATPKPVKAMVTSSVTPPSAVTSAFSSAYSGAADVRWQKTPDGMYSAEFTNDKVRTKTVYTSAGALDRTRVSIPTSSIPAAVNTAVAPSLNVQTIQKAFQVTLAKSSTVYYNIRFNSQDHYFNAAGSPVKWDKANDKPAAE